ncbi:DUF4265 domain-containing protein [Mucilaginibacter ginsenosidivorans]|uniref:DUF4265 domain-containing protein n=1 Tax=Mucilaginibacter ginsenosidivorans TaxID=398053 RepID=A0A5B8UVW7_9SPHI|nr:DUF4265 domain-containing protein [Mucilaginibacter ginsenosidivorans]QEC63038.1 DUF4265 domain-containing protein [Mucilaginibacter ginsenosidivorans]
MMDKKVLLVYSDEGEFKTESVWATKIGDYYRIDNIPFFAKNIAPGDIISVENDDGELYFDSLIEPSGNSVVRLIFCDKNNIEATTKALEEMGCNWEGSHLSTLIAVEIPKTVPYQQVKLFLENGFNNGLYDYQEACLGFK